MEWYIDAGEWDRRKSTLQSDVACRLLKLRRFVVAVLDDFAQHLLDLLDSELLGQLVKEERMRKVRC